MKKKIIIFFFEKLEVQMIDEWKSKTYSAKILIFQEK